ncbi:nuclease-related domain-containing protein, partial [Alkalibacterium sp.]
MEVLKEREKSKLLKGLNILDNRLELNETDKRYLINLQKGFNGEQFFDASVRKVMDKEVIILNDLFLRNKGISFQIDSMILTSDTLFVFEIKNFSGKYIRNSDGFSTVKGYEVANPLIQLSRMESFVHQLLNEWKIISKVEANVLFIDPSFSLYNARIEDPIILPNQLEEYLESINRKSKVLNREQYYLANNFIKLHENEVPHERQLPYYSYEELKKGLSCKSCGSFNMLITQRSCYCKSCFNKSSVEEV